LIAVDVMREYIGTNRTQAQKRPLVVERERINFECESAFPQADHPAPAEDAASSRSPQGS
jgi:hypothetical protein